MRTWGNWKSGQTSKRTVTVAGLIVRVCAYRSPHRSSSVEWLTVAAALLPVLILGTAGYPSCGIVFSGLDRAEVD